MTATAPENLTDARDWLRERMDDGQSCPCCGQFAKVYRRRIHGAMARDLIRAWRTAGSGWFHIRAMLGHDGGDFAKLAYWGLIEEFDATRHDGGRAGVWRITARGYAYVGDALRVPTYARVFDGRLLELTGDLVGIRDALGKRFNLEELMAGV